LAVSFADYRLPTVVEAPAVEVVVVERPMPDSPLGLKGAGEAGIVGAGAAVANAVADALGEAAGEVLELPLTPPRVNRLARHNGP
jgi:aerobic carbon-monoxide dehydrogenase large subunit